MNRLRSQKFKPNTDVIVDHVNGGNNNNSNSSNMNSNNINCSNISSSNINSNYVNNSSNSLSNNTGGLLNKISKRYSTLSNRITRRNQSGIARKSDSPSKVVSGSYDMTGANSEDHRLEIGAPVLISTTTLDTDRFDVSEERLRQIGGGIAATNNTLIRRIDVHASPKTPSSGSENEVFVDALSTPPIVALAKSNAEMQTEEEDKFELAMQALPKRPSEDLRRRATYNKESSPESQAATTTTITSSSSSSESRIATPTAKPMLTLFQEVSKPVRTKPKQLNKKQHSKSATNLHKSELKVFLQKAPSMEYNMNMTIADMENFTDIPKIPELFGASQNSLTPNRTADCLDYANDADKENSSPSGIVELHSKSDPNTPMCAEQKVCGYLTQQHHFKSVDSLDIHRSNSVKRRSVIYSSDNSLNQRSSTSKNSLNSQTSAIEDFDLKSVSCQSLNAQTLYVSIEELNEITRQINESEEFNNDIDLEYCTHRDNLKPSERRITLLKNKNSRLISFNNNKEKIKKGWCGVKHWIGEESSKLKEVVQKTPALQKFSASRLNLSNAECRQSPSVHGSVLLRNSNDKRADSHDKMLTQTDSNITITTSALDSQGGAAAAAAALNFSPTGSSQEIGVSCDNIAEHTETEQDDLNSSFTNTQGDDASLTTKLATLEGQNGFEELRRYIKQGGDFSKELILILQERVESEMLYSKSLSKMANKLNKACRELPGSIAEAWRGVATEMESRSDIHRQLSASLTDEIVKPLKGIVDNHHKTRKSVETNVDKAARVLTEWRVSEGKAKKSSHTAARENEKLQDAMLDVRIQKSPSIALLHQGPNKMAAEKEIKSAEKDCAKLDNKRKKAEEAVKRADVEYYTLCVRAERARVDWEMAVVRGSSLLQTIENQRLVNMKNFVANYTSLTANMNPILDGLVQRLQPQIDACNVLKDLQVVKNIRRNAEGPSEQLLPDFYCEHTTLAMNRERRKHSLIKLLQLVKADLERERRSRNGLKGLSQSLNNQENQNITDKLYHIRSMLTYLEGARFKLHSALLELDHKPRSSHPLAQHIQITRDRTGLQQSILKVPLWLKNNDKLNTSTTSSAGDESMHDDSDYDRISQVNASTNASCIDISQDALANKFNRSKSNIETFTNNSQQICLTAEKKSKTIQTNLDDPYSDRGQADGGSNQQDSDFDEFSSQDEDDDEQQSITGRKEHKGTNISQYQNTTEIHNEQQQISATSSTPIVILSRCKALYSYTPKLYDELELNPGDIIEVHAKQEDGWWLGALGNQVGIFPATYVEEFA